jgi:hypothetical protein
VSGIPDEYWESIEGLSILGVYKVALDVFQSTVRVYMSRDSQSFFQKFNAAFKVRNVMVGPFDLKTGTPADGHSNSIAV